MYVGLVVTALLGWLLNFVMDEVERVVIPWRAPESRGLSIPLPDPIRNWFMATRPLSFTASAIPVLIGTLLAADVGDVDLSLFLMVIVASVLVHAGSNLVNDYFDWKNGADKPNAHGRYAFIQRGIIQPRAIFAFGLILFGIATAIGLSIVYIVGWPVLLFALPSLAAAYFYTGGPKPLGYVALGEATVFLFMGPVIVVGSYFVQTGNIAWAPVLLSVPVGLLVTAHLQANNIRDIQDDMDAGKRTLATYIGRRWANREYVSLLFGSYVVLALIALGGIVPAGVLIVFLTIPRAIEVTRIILERDEARFLNAALRQTAGIHLQFGLLLSAVLLVQAIA
jgi:1,4-dihydroxy-2-naphthoate octaprenyltransferase